MSGLEPTAPDIAEIVWTDRGAHPLLAYCCVFQADRGDGVLTAFAGREPIGWFPPHEIEGDRP